MLTLLNKHTSVLAVDPGLSGAIARMGRGELIVRRDFKHLRDISAAIRDLTGNVDHIVVELVHAMPGQGVCSMFSFGKSTGTAHGSIYTLRPFENALEEVSPQKWQNFFRNLCKKDWWETLTVQKNGTVKSTFDARKLALRLLPQHADLFRRKKDHNTADAVLLGLWKLHQL